MTKCTWAKLATFRLVQMCNSIYTCVRRSVYVVLYTYIWNVCACTHLHNKTTLYMQEYKHIRQAIRHVHASWQTATSTNFPDGWWRHRRMLSLLNKWEMTACEELLQAPSPQNPKNPCYWVRVVNNKEDDCLILKGYCTAIIVYVKQQRQVPWLRYKEQHLTKNNSKCRCDRH